MLANHSIQNFNANASKALKGGTSNMRILIVEDYDIMRRALEFKLAKEGYEVICAANGADAIEKLKQENFDLVISDIMMPFVNGLEVLNTLRNILKKETPVIMLTSVGLEKTVLQAFEMGADDFITKPFSPNELIVRINRVFASKKNNQ
jgi:DNA-binding response OmpR family regulator